MLITTETVFRGHPDKVCDQISDAILDACLKGDPSSRVACETMGGKGKIFISGEITTKAKINYQQITKRVLKDIGYNPNHEIITNLSKQSQDIALGTNDDIGGAGDQGIMFGYATNETKEMLDLPFVLCQKMAIEYDKHQRKQTFLNPDGKCQITMEYQNNIPKRIHTLIFSHQHTKEYKKEDNYILNNIINKICKGYIDKDTKILINPTGNFIIGGFEGDAGLTGRKIIVDTYGGFAKHGGGAFSGKDDTKVDRSAAYMLRHIAKQIIKNKYADKIEIQISYAIGIKEPLSININTFNTHKIPIEDIYNYINTYDLTPKGIINYLNLTKPIFEQTARYGHFGENKFL